MLINASKMEEEDGLRKKMGGGGWRGVRVPGRVARD
jgi:hypothetical protein